MEASQDIARKEIRASLKLSFFASHCLGLSFEKPRNEIVKNLKNILFFSSVFFIIMHASSDFIFICITFSNSDRVEDIVPLLHTQGYAILNFIYGFYVLGAIKAAVLWYKKPVFQQLLAELSLIWPVYPKDEETQTVKNKSLKTLRIVHAWYFAVNFLGVWFFNLTPISVYLYRRFRGSDAKLGTIWSSWYPFDKTEPLSHIVCVYIFEAIMGQVCVWVTISSDLLFSGMASHIVLLLRFLQCQLKSLKVSGKTENECHHEIVECIRLHQRLIRYCKGIGEAFSFVNLINIVVSSINICCVVFTVLLLEPLVAVSNKLFLMSALIQVGMLCWYGQDIIQANSDIAVAAYNCDWYKMTPKCRRALLFIIRRTQKPIGFTAMNFTYISLVTYAAILTRSYSYFALLYTMYNKK